MLATIKLESIGDNARSELNGLSSFLNMVSPGLGSYDKVSPRCWVAEITGIDKRFKWKRNFLKGRKDYSEANSKGSRGVFIHFTIEINRVYEIKQPISWKNDNRYFCHLSEDGSIVKIDEEEVLPCLIKFGSVLPY